jgi:hypothetical protein
MRSVKMQHTILFAFRCPTSSGSSSSSRRSAIAITRLNRCPGPTLSSIKDRRYRLLPKNLSQNAYVPFAQHSECCMISHFCASHKETRDDYPAIHQVLKKVATVDRRPFLTLVNYGYTTESCTQQLQTEIITMQNIDESYPYMHTSAYSFADHDEGLNSTSACSHICP